jgi:FtsZ-interacting cell division protein ZipA
MGNGNLILAKKMAQSIIKDGVVRDMDLFTDISVVLKQASDQDPEAKSLLNRINLIKLSNMSQPKASIPPPPQYAAPVEEKISPPVQPRNTPPVQPKVVGPSQPKNQPVQNKPAAPVQPKSAAPVQGKVNTAKQNTSAAAKEDEDESKKIPIGLWLLAIILVLPGGIIASMMAKKINPAKSGALLIVGILTTILAAMLIVVSMKYAITF